ncbi:MAG TPA: lysophospholipid acyltransferase family protein [Candidatus Polarisedimenticolaceae bacterium]|nr:lysophospholipid acyltransferase family protein [Candidatus Polarisedimenticolaceae bacterium]
MTRTSHRIAVGVGRAVALPLLRAGFDLRVEGADRVPARGPALLVSNHLSFMDPVVLQGALARPIHYLMTARLYRDRRWQWFYRLFDTVPVTLGSGNFKALAEAAARLRAGEVVGVFPEGGISKDGSLGPFRRGAALLAMRTGTPVIPVAIAGTREALPPGTLRLRRALIRVRVGEAVAPEETLEPGPMTERIREAVAALGRGGA